MRVASQSRSAVAEHLTITSLVLLAAILRLSWLDMIPFKLDEVDALSRARALVDHGVLPPRAAKCRGGYRIRRW